MGLCCSIYAKSTYESVSQIDDEILNPPPSAFPCAPQDIESESDNDYEVVSDNEIIPINVKPQVAYRRRWWGEPR